MSSEIESTMYKFGWSPESLPLAIDTGFKCAYCDKDFMSSIDNYYSFEIEHIVPRSRQGTDLPENKTVVCTCCNFLKRAWDPREEVGYQANRAQLLTAARAYVAKRRREKDDFVAGQRPTVTKLLNEAKL